MLGNIGILDICFLFIKRNLVSNLYYCNTIATLPTTLDIHRLTSIRTFENVNCVPELNCAIHFMHNLDICINEGYFKLSFEDHIIDPLRAMLQQIEANYSNRTL